MECSEKEALTRDQRYSLEVLWGDVEVVRQLLQMIPCGRGIGDLSAEDIMRASPSHPTWRKC